MISSILVIGLFVKYNFNRTMLCVQRGVPIA